jgi:putative transposase
LFRRIPARSVQLVNSLKGLSSRLLRESRPEITGRYRKGVLWSPSCFAASCGGAPLSVVADYVKSQGKRPSAALAFLPHLKEGVSREDSDDLLLARAPDCRSNVLIITSV